MGLLAPVVPMLFLFMHSGSSLLVPGEVCSASRVARSSTGAIAFHLLMEGLVYPQLGLTGALLASGKAQGAFSRYH